MDKKPLLTTNYTKRFVDDRGTLNNCDLPFVAKRIYTCYNHQQNTVRGYIIHQKEQKFFTCIRGAIKFVVAKAIMRDDLSLTFDKSDCMVYILTSEKTEGLYVPCGYASAYQTLTKNAILLAISDMNNEDSAKDSIRIDPLLTESIWETKWR